MALGCGGGGSGSAGGAGGSAGNGGSNTAGQPGRGGATGTGGPGLTTGETGGRGGTGGSGAGGAGGNTDSAMDSTDGPIEGGADSQSCINLADIPTAWVRTADSSERIVSMRVLDGPCKASASIGPIVTFYYWEMGYSCPLLGDRITCEVEATSSAGATAVFTVKFTAVPLTASMLHWQAEPSQITVTFPGLDGGAAGG